MSTGADFFDDLRDAIRSHFGDGTAATVIEQDLRQRWAGSRVYIAARPAAEVMARNMSLRFANGETRNEAFACFGVSRSTGFRVLRRTK